MTKLTFIYEKIGFIIPIIIIIVCLFLTLLYFKKYNLFVVFLFLAFFANLFIFSSEISDFFFQYRKFLFPKLLIFFFALFLTQFLFWLKNKSIVITLAFSLIQLVLFVSYFHEKIFALSQIDVILIIVLLVNSIFFIFCFYNFVLPKIKNYNFQNKKNYYSYLTKFSLVNKIIFIRDFLTLKLCYLEFKNNLTVIIFFILTQSLYFFLIWNLQYPILIMIAVTAYITSIRGDMIRNNIINESDYRKNFIVVGTEVSQDLIRLKTKLNPRGIFKYSMFKRNMAFAKIVIYDSLEIVFYKKPSREFLRALYFGAGTGAAAGIGAYCYHEYQETERTKIIQEQKEQTERTKIIQEEKTKRLGMKQDHELKLKEYAEKMKKKGWF